MNSRALASLKVGILHSGSKAENGQQIAAVLSGLAEAGYVDGDNITVTTLWADNDPVLLRNNARSLISLPGAQRR